MALQVDREKILDLHCNDLTCYVTCFLTALRASNSYIHSYLLTFRIFSFFPGWRVSVVYMTVELKFLVWYITWQSVTDLVCLMAKSKVNSSGWCCLYGRGLSVHSRMRPCDVRLCWSFRTVDVAPCMKYTLKLGSCCRSLSDLIVHVHINVVANKIYSLTDQLTGHSFICGSAPQ